MSTIIAEYIATTTAKVAKDLVTAFERLPDEKRTWQPLDKGRSAADQLAECALLNGYTAQVIKTRQWPSSAFDEFMAEKAALVQDITKLHATFEANLPVILEAIRGVADDQLTIEVEMPWGARPMSEMINYPLWNMSYHEGQINYIYYLNEEK